MAGSRCRFACIVDGDNVTRGGQLGLAGVCDVMAYVAHLAEGWPVTCALQRRVAVDYMRAYAPHGWAVKFASMDPDAADAMLLEVADDYLEHGITDLVVVSGDHAFATLASRARLHVVAYDGGLSRELADVAATVTLLDEVVVMVAA